MIQNQDIFATRQGQATLKVSNFSPKFNDTLLSRLSNAQSDKPSERKKLLHTSYAQNRLSPQSSPIKLRTIHTSYQPRNADETDRKASLIHSPNRYNQELLPCVGQNISELKEVMKQKIAAIKEMTRAQQHIYYFSEYRMKGIERDRWNLSTLHSRKVNETPTPKTSKQKKIALENRYHETRVLPQKSKREKSSKKMVLIGGSIPVRAISSNPEAELTYSPLKTARKQLKIGHVQSLRRNHQTRNPEIIERYENDCRPWEIHRGEQMQESANLYLFER